LRQLLLLLPLLPLPLRVRVRAWPLAAVTVYAGLPLPLLPRLRQLLSLLPLLPLPLQLPRLRLLTLVTAWQLLPMVLGAKVLGLASSGWCGLGVRLVVREDYVAVPVGYRD
jgi:hypothetical protein